MAVRCPRCGGKRVSKNEKPNNFEWICDACKREFNSSSEFNNNDNSSFDDFDIDSVYAEVKRRKKERLEREAKGIYVETSLDLLGGCSTGVLNILYGKFIIPSLGDEEDKLNHIALNNPTKDIEIAIKEAEEQFEREKAERERKGIYLDKNLKLLRGCSAEVLEIIYDKFLVSNIQFESDKLNSIALNYPTKDIRIAIKEAEVERERKEREEKGIYVEKSLDLLGGCSTRVLNILYYSKFNMDFIGYSEDKLNSIALNYPTKDIEITIKEAEEQIEREKAEGKERERRDKEKRERLEREKFENEIKEKAKLSEITKLKEEIEIFENSGRYEKAIECYDKIIELDHSNEVLWKNKGNCYYDLGRYDEAIECYSKAIEINPSYEVPWYNIGTSYFDRRRYDEAIEWYDKTIEINPSYEAAWHNKGSSLIGLGRIEEAIECYDKVLELNPSYEIPWYNKAMYLVNLERYEEAIECYDKVLELNPSNKDALHNKGVCLEKLESEKREKEKKEKLKRGIKERERLEKERRKREERAKMVRMYKCPICGSPLYKKDNISGIGQFYNCEHCGYIKSSDDVNNLSTANFSASTLDRCPRCGGSIILKSGGPRGIFYGCVNFPICDFAYSSLDQTVSQTSTYAKDHTTNPRYYSDYTEYLELFDGTILATNPRYCGDNKPLIRSKKQNKKETIPKLTSAKDHTTNPRYYTDYTEYLELFDGTILATNPRYCGDNKPLIRSKKQNKKETIPKLTSAKDHTTNPRYYGDNRTHIRPKDHTNQEWNNIYEEKNYIITDIISKQNKSNSSKKSQDKNKRIKDESYTDYIFRINSQQKVSDPKDNKEKKKQTTTKTKPKNTQTYQQRIEGKTKNTEKPVKNYTQKVNEKTNSNITNNNNAGKWAIILTAIAICLIFLIVAAGINNDNSEYGVTDELEYQNSARGVHLNVWNEESDFNLFHDSNHFKKGNPIIIVMKDTAYWESMTGCVVSVNLKNKETGDEYDIDCTITENSYGYIDTDELPLGEYEVYASYYGDEDHYANYYTDIEIVT